MRSYEREDVQPATAEECLRESYNATDLTQYVRSFVGTKPPTRKDDLVALLLRLLEGDQLRLNWAKLSHREQAKAAQTAWSTKGFFDRDKFNASYNPTDDQHRNEGEQNESGGDEDIDRDFSWNSKNKRKDSLLQIMLPHGVMARDIQKRLREFVPKPSAHIIVGDDSPPDFVKIPTSKWDSKTKSHKRAIEDVPVEQREMERPALNDLKAVLRLVDAGKIAVTDKNRWPTPSAIRHITAVLDGGDYYPPDDSNSSKGKNKDEDGDDGDHPGPIRAFAWPLLLQAGKLAQTRGSRIELTKAGRAALMAPPHETIKDLWNHWSGSDLLDELRRISIIRGQTGRGKRYLTDPDKRRQAIEAALCECPIGRWTKLDEFSRHMRAAGHEFEVSSDPWSLYIFDPQYGSLQYEGYGGWNILQFRYLLCVLMEFAATLGLIDVAFIPPTGARLDFSGMWGADDLAYFSRYDGLMALRLNGLGAFVLGLAESYVPPPLAIRQIIRVDPNLLVVGIQPVSSADALLLETFAQKTGDGVWRLDPEKMLDAEGAGRSAKELAAFLHAASGAPLPEPVERLFAELAGRADALRDLGPARLIRCADPSLAAFIANDPSVGKLCSLTGPDKLVVAVKDEASFHRALRKLGFILRPPVS